MKPNSRHPQKIKPNFILIKITTKIQSFWLKTHQGYKNEEYGESMKNFIFKFWNGYSYSSNTLSFTFLCVGSNGSFWEREEGVKRGELGLYAKEETQMEMATVKWIMKNNE